MGVYTGSNFAEAFEGTNGLGTALAEQRPILVHRDEHFREQWGIFSCAVAPLFDHGGRLAGAVNITSCRNDLGRTAHQLALAVTMEATHRIERSIFRRRFRNAWIATVPGEGGSGLIAYDDDRRVVGACRSARSMLELTDSLLESASHCPMSSGSTTRLQTWRMAASNFIVPTAACWGRGTLRRRFARNRRGFHRSSAAKFLRAGLSA